MNVTTADKLLEDAQAGERRAFDELAAPVIAQLRAVVQRMVGHPEDSEEIVQDSLVKAWTGIRSFRGESAFSTWLTSIATRAAIDFLRGQKRWRPEAQVAYANLCAQSEAMSGEVLAQYAAPDFAYEVREHISYCFTCVGRSLPPDEIAALVLRDVLGLSAREASDVLGVSDSILRHRLSAARRAMQERFEGLCSLVSKNGVCYQCKGLQMIAPEDRKGGEFPDVADFADRCAVVRNSNSSSMAGLHAVFWRNTKRVEAEGAGSIEADSGCGEGD